MKAYTSSWLIIAVNKYPETKLHRKKVGFELDKLQLDKVYQSFLKFADVQKEINDDDIPKIVEAANI